MSLGETPTDTETSAVEWGTRTITYDIRRSARRKTVAVSVDASDGVVLTAPVGVSVERLDAVVRGRAQWIVEKLRAVERQARPPRRELVSGESLLYLGRNHRLKLVEREATVPARMERGQLVVEVRPGLAGGARTRAIRSALEAWYHAHAVQRLGERVELWAPRVGVATPRVLVPQRAPSKRWGSCDAKGVLRFSWLIIQAPGRLVDYVVAHELVHLVHHDHGAEFWDRLEDAMPDAQARRKALLRQGPLLQW